VLGRKGERLLAAEPDRPSNELLRIPGRGYPSIAGWMLRRGRVLDLRQPAGAVVGGVAGAERVLVLELLPVDR
jgi:hypothetical protein